MKTSNIAKTLAVFCLVNNFNPVKADQPVHCLKENIMGNWQFVVSTQIEEVNLFQTKEFCTHKIPNKVQIQNPDHAYQFAQSETWNLDLQDGYKAVATKEGGAAVNGTWSSIYDQAMRVELEDGTRFVTNFRYDVKGDLSVDALAEGYDHFAQGFGTGDYASFDSVCGKTMVGFVQQSGGNGSTMKNHRGQCFYGKQTKANHALSSSEVTVAEAKIAQISGSKVNAAAAAEGQDVDQIESSAEDVQTDAQAAATTEAEAPATADAPSDETNLMIGSTIRSKQHTFQRKSHRRYNAHHAHVPSDENDLMIQAINDLNLTWKADTCKLQKHHVNYGAHCQKHEALALAQTHSKTDEDSAASSFGQQENFATSWDEAKKYQKYSSAQDIPESDLPANFDWRNVNGVDFTSKHRDQGHCGSCYTVSFTQIVEQRLRLKYGKDMPMLSPQFMMTCNYMNEGCDGGWPFFHGFLAENGHLVTEECAPYQGKTKGDKCSNYEQCAPHSKIEKTRFVGKGYGDTSEKKMMQEIIRNGMVNGELNAPHIFHMYTKGVLTADGIKELHKKALALAQVRSQSDETTDETKGAKPAAKPVAKKSPKTTADPAKDVTDKSLAEYGIEWQNLNHSVVILGWGVDPSTSLKYWIVRNSYGPRWGDHGEFLVQRGTDDFGIESETTAYDPVLL